jgi:hypothetical protein
LKEGCTIGANSTASRGGHRAVGDGWRRSDCSSQRSGFRAGAGQPGQITRVGLPLWGETHPRFRTAFGLSVRAAL